MLPFSLARPRCPSHCLPRQPLSSSPRRQEQTRHATLLRRPKRPYTFTQLVTLSDGSTFTHRTTSPQPVYKTTKDTKNHALWNPSSQKLLNIEEDEAGRLKRFRKRFGRGFDVETFAAEGGEESSENSNVEETSASQQPDESLMDLISSFGRGAGDSTGAAAGADKARAKGGKGKGKGGAD